MRKRMMAALCMAAVFLVFAGCGDSAGTAAQESSQTGQESSQTGQESSQAGQDGSQAGQDSQDTGEHVGTEAADMTDDGKEQDTAAPASSGEQTAQLAGKSVSILGDSISTFRGHNPEGHAVFFPDYGAVQAVEDTWWRRVVDDLELTLYQNSSNAGATVVGDSTGMEDPLCAVNELRTGALMGPQGACPDIILVYLGTNDLLNTVPMGENDGTALVEEGEVETFSDAYSLMLDKLQAKYPPAEIYCCTLLPVGEYGTETPYVEFVNGDALTAVDYSETIVKIAQIRGLGVIDLQNCGVTIDNLHEMTSDGVHPTQEGMVCITQAVKKTLTGQ